MEWLVWAGALISLIGLIGVIWCIVKVMAARRAGLADEALKAVVQRLIPVNLGAFLLSTIGLMMVVIGVILG